MDFYTHMQHVQHKQQEATLKYREREQRAIILDHNRKSSFGLWKVIWAWFMTRRHASTTDEFMTVFIGYLQPRKTKIVQYIHKYT